MEPTTPSRGHRSRTLRSKARRRHASGFVVVVTLALAIGGPPLWENTASEAGGEAARREAPATPGVRSQATTGPASPDLAWAEAGAGESDPWRAPASFPDGAPERGVEALLLLAAAALLRAAEAEGRVGEGSGRTLPAIGTSRRRRGGGWR